MFLGFPGSSDGKESIAFPCNEGNLGSIPGLGRSPGEGNGCPLQYSDLENSTDCIVHSCKESDTTEQLPLSTYKVVFLEVSGRGKTPTDEDGEGNDLNPH